VLYSSSTECRPTLAGADSAYRRSLYRRLLHLLVGSFSEAVSPTRRCGQALSSPSECRFRQAGKGQLRSNLAQVSASHTTNPVERERLTALSIRTDCQNVNNRSIDVWILSVDDGR
jgi:hypothetical protein